MVKCVIKDNGIERLWKCELEAVVALILIVTQIDAGMISSGKVVCNSCVCREIV